MGPSWFETFVVAAAGEPRPLDRRTTVRHWRRRLTKNVTLGGTMNGARSTALAGIFLVMLGSSGASGKWRITLRESNASSTKRLDVNTRSVWRMAAAIGKADSCHSADTDAGPSRGRHSCL